MGFNTTASTNTLIARLTPYGRQRLLAGNINIITKFGLGDSDSNYYTSEPIPTGGIPNISGLIGDGNKYTNSSAVSSMIRNIVRRTATSLFKPIVAESYMVTSQQTKLGEVTVPLSGLTQQIIDRTNLTESTTNLFRTFGLPITDAEKTLYTSTPVVSGGFSDSGLKWLNQDKAVVIGINQNKYGEQFDGKTIKVTVTVGGTPYEIYGTYNKVSTTQIQDTNIQETSSTPMNGIGSPITALFSDTIKRPNGDTSKSWGTGFGTMKPFTLGNKEMFNYKTSNSGGLTADTVVGMAYLDKGFIVLTHPDIVNTFDVNSTATTVTFDSVVTEIAQNITCLKSTEEFKVSTNPTFSNGDNVRISELGLYDDNDMLVAIAKLDKQLVLPPPSTMAFGVKITV